MDEKKYTIIKKGFELFKLYGIRSVTMEDLSKELGVSKKTLYQYFENKTHLVKEIMEHSANEIQNELETEPEENVNAIEEFFFYRREVLRKLSHQNPAIAFDLRKYYPEVFNKLKETRRNVLYKVHLKNLEKGIQEGLYREDLDMDFISRLMTGGHVFTFDPVNRIFSEEELLSEKFKSNLFNYHFRGICSEKGLKIFKELKKQSESGIQ